MKKIFAAVLLLFVCESSAFSAPFVLPLASNNEPLYEYNLPRMKQMNPDFTTYPDEFGIIWLKHVIISRTNDGGMQVTRLYVILGRQGLNENWLTWNIQIPDKGSIEILEADIYDYDNLLKISNVAPEENFNAGITKINFSGLSEKFIIVLAWNEILPQQLTIEGSCNFQEELRIWEAITEIYSPQELFYKTFPERYTPDTEDFEGEILYRWRHINVDPYAASRLIRTQRRGAIFSARQGTSNLLSITRDSESFNPALKYNGKNGAAKFMSWLEKQPEIVFAEGTPRKMPSQFPLSKREKLIFAKNFLTSNKINASFAWRIPFEPDEETPLCSAMFYDPVLDIQGVRGLGFSNMNSQEIIEGSTIYSLNKENNLISRKIPSSKSSENRITANMNLKLDENGALNGNIKVILRGNWKKMKLDVPSLFPDLTNYNDVKYKSSEISFSIQDKKGIAGAGQGILAALPFFEPVEVRKLGDFNDGVEINFPFIMEQNIDLDFPKSLKEALVSGKVAKNPDKINYGHHYRNKKHGLNASARFELDMTRVSSGNVSLLRRYLDQWRIFSSKVIPVR